MVSLSISSSLVVLLIVNVSCDDRAEGMSMSPVSKHMKRCVGREHTVYITVGHRLEKELDKESSFIDSTRRVWWDGK